MQYILTWVSLALLLLSGLALVILSWNGGLRGQVSPSLLIFWWFLSSASGIYLFMVAVRRAHRHLKLDERKNRATKNRQELPGKGAKKTDELDFAAAARKMVRRMPETELQKSGKTLMQLLAKELEIMSGVLYCRSGQEFKEVATYALPSPEGPLHFKEGEGLPGQVARNRQSMILTHFPEHYLEVCSGLGQAEPAWLAIIPFVENDKTIAVLECSGFCYDPKQVEAMFRIFTRELMDKLSAENKKN